MSVIALVNRKAGVGTTTLTVGLADFLSFVHMKKILVLDLNPQTGASIQLLGEERWAQLDQRKKTIMDLLLRAREGEALDERLLLHDFIQEQSVQPLVFGGIQVLCSTPRLQALEDDFVTHPESFRYVSPYHLLANVLGQTLLPRFDYVLLDCPPSLNFVTLNGLTCADGYLVPMIPDYVSTVGFSPLVEGIRAHSRSLRRPLKAYGTLIQRLNPQLVQHQSILAELRAKPEAQPVWDTLIQEVVRPHEAIHPESRGRSLKQLYGVQYDVFRQLSEEFLRRVPR